MQIIGENIGNLMAAFHFTANDLADRMNALDKNSTPVTFSRISQWKRSVRIPAAERIDVLARVFNVPSGLLQDHIFNEHEIEMIVQGQGHQLSQKPVLSSPEIVTLIQQYKVFADGTTTPIRVLPIATTYRDSTLKAFAVEKSLLTDVPINSVAVVAAQTEPYAAHTKVLVLDDAGVTIATERGQVDHEFLVLGALRQIIKDF